MLSLPLVLDSSGSGGSAAHLPLLGVLGQGPMSEVGTVTSLAGVEVAHTSFAAKKGSEGPWVWRFPRSCHIP